MPTTTEKPIIPEFLKFIRTNLQKRIPPNKLRDGVIKRLIAMGYIVKN